jgi:hypothetical protein
VQARAGRVPDGHADRAVLELIFAQARSQPGATKKGP